MNKKICLITYCSSYNYGAALQLFATYKKLEMMGNKVTILDYQNEFEASQLSLRYLLTNADLKAKTRFILSSYVFCSRSNGKKNFLDFYRCMNYTQHVKSIREVEKMKQFDIFCVGSDQVWNPRITDGFDEVFTLNGKLPRKISYASSMGSLQFDGFSEKELISRLADFDSISVREKGAYQYLAQRLPDKAVEQVVDPTILYGRECWDKSICEANVKPPLPEKYVLVYALGGCFESLNSLAHKIAVKIGAKVAVITLSNRPKKVDYLLNHATPLEFVNYIKNAAFVVTNSFHGTCFSLIYGTPFYSVRYGDNPARAEELLEKYHLSDRLYREGNPIEDGMMSNDDICLARLKLEEDATASEKWLEGALNE